MRFSAALLSLLAFSSLAQQPSNLLLLDVSLTQPGKILQAKPLTDNADYTNQPHFIAGQEALYYTQAFSSDSGQQMDSMLYNLSDHSAVNLTRSATSEYSPTPYLQGFSTILVDADGIQWLWAFTQDGESKGKLSSVEPIGYHVWVDESTALAFVLGEPHTLQALKVNAKASVIDKRIGPSLWQIPDTERFSYTRQVQEGEDAPWQLISYAPKTGDKAVLTELPPGAYYYAWLPDGSAVAASGNKIHRWQAATQWRPWLDTSEYCTSVTRLHARMSKDTVQLVVVCS